MYKKSRYPDGMRFFPTFVYADMAVIFAALSLLCALVFFFPEWLATPDSQIPADPFNTPEHIKPEWYFLAPYQLLKLMPEIFALILQTLAMLAFIFLPFLDRSKECRIIRRPLFFVFTVGTLFIFAFLTWWGAVS